MSAPRVAWRITEDVRLREMWPTAPADQLRSAFPGRSWVSLKSRAWRLGVARDRREVQMQAVNKHRDEQRTTSERRCLDYVLDCYHRTGFGPMRSEVAAVTGMSHSTVNAACGRLIDRGVLVRSPGRSAAVGPSPALRRRLEQRRAA